MPGITNPTEEYFKDGNWGWDGTRWRKLNLVFGYYDTTAELLSNLNADSGQNLLTGTVVPAGYVYVIQAAHAFDNTTDITQIIITAVVSGIAVYMVLENPAGIGIPVVWVGQITLKAGDRMRASFYSCTAGDDIYFAYCGYKMMVS